MGKHETETTTLTILTPDQLKQKIGLIPNYPKEGITFKDLGPLYQDKQSFASLIENLSSRIREEIENFDYVAAMEAQGFILGGALAEHLNKGFIQIRKAGELPGLTRRKNFEMQYATTAIEIQRDIIKPESKVLIFDDAIATGKTAFAAKQLIEEEKGVVSGFVFVMELDGFGGRKLLTNNHIVSLIHFSQE